MPQKKETPLWWTALKLVLLAVALIGGTGLALWYAAEHQKLQLDPAVAPVTSGSSWGIAGDSPLKPKR